jgi:hypothetical protein
MILKVFMIFNSWIQRIRERLYPTRLWHHHHTLGKFLHASLQNYWRGWVETLITYLNPSPLTLTWILKIKALFKLERLYIILLISGSCFTSKQENSQVHCLPSALVYLYTLTNDLTIYKFTNVWQFTNVCSTFTHNWNKIIEMSLVETTENPWLLCSQALYSRLTNQASILMPQKISLGFRRWYFFAYS